MPFASAKPASLFLVRSATLGTIPEVSEVPEVPAQAPVSGSGLRAFLVTGLVPPSPLLRAFPVTGLVPFSPFQPLARAKRQAGRQPMAHLFLCEAPPQAPPGGLGGPGGPGPGASHAQRLRACPVTGPAPFSPFPAPFQPIEKFFNFFHKPPCAPTNDMIKCRRL